MEIGKNEFNAFRKEMNSFRQDVKTGFGAMTQLLGENNARLDETNARLDETNANLKRFQRQVGGKLDGISDFLIASESARQTLDTRVTRLEERVGRLEDHGPAA
jgi:archaellum component FlaC